MTSRNARRKLAWPAATLITLLPLAFVTPGCATPSPRAVSSTDYANDLAYAGALGTRVRQFDTDLAGGHADRAHAALEGALSRARGGGGSADDHLELGYMLVRMGRGTEALTHLDQAVQKADGSPTSQMVAHVWAARAHVLLEDYELAEREYRAALDVGERIPGGMPTLQGATLDVLLADVVRQRGHCSKAVVDYERLARLSDPRQRGPDELDLAHKVWARAKTGVARCELEAARVDAALRQATELEQWLATHTDNRGRAYLNVLDVAPELLRLLSDIALTKGDVEQAKRRRHESAQLVLADTSAGLDPIRVDTVLDSAWFALGTGDSASAIRDVSALRESIERQGITQGATAARILAADGAIALQAGDATTAKRSLSAAVDIQRREGLEVSLAENLPLLASAQLAAGETDAARGSAEEGATLARRYGEHEAAARLALARATWAAGNPGGSMPHWAGLDAIEERTLRATMMFASAEAQRVILARQTPMIDITATLAELGHGNAATFGFETLLRRKGRLLDASASTLGTLDARSGSTKTKLEQIAKLRADVSRLSLTPPPGLGPDEVQSRLDALTNQIAEIEATIGDDVSWIARNKQLEKQIGWRDVQRQLDSGEALLEYVDYAGYSPVDGTTSERRLGAYVLRSEGAPTFVKLAVSSEVARAVRDLREALAGRQGWESHAQALYQLVYAPLSSALDGVDTLLVSPDGALNLVPFAVLGSGKTSLMGRYAVSYVSSGRDLLQAPPVNAHASDPIVIASPSYDERGVSAGGSGQQRSARMQGVRFVPLPGTRSEGEAVAKALKVTPLLGASATESALKAARGPHVLHIATHGFFLDADENAARRGSRGLVLAPQESAAGASLELDENPLLRSGLALAGANVASSSGEDGVLTGLEASSLDLRGTQLVVLSACETGVGEVDAGEGVYGLRRAFQLASSETQVISLWEVDDKATEMLMRTFYSNLSKGESRSQALRNAQDWLRKKEAYAHPYFWAAFILSGERGPLRE